MWFRLRLRLRVRWLWNVRECYCSQVHGTSTGTHRSGSKKAERLNGIQEVGGSIPPGSTKHFNGLAANRTPRKELQVNDQVNGSPDCGFLNRWQALRAPMEHRLLAPVSAAAIALAVVLSSGGGLYPSRAQAQPSIQIGPGGIRVDDGRGRRGGGQCEELRLACENKDRLGSRARVIAGVTAKCASASLAGKCAKSAPRASTKIGWGSRARVIAGVTGKPVASYGESSGSPFSQRPCDESFAHRP